MTSDVLTISQVAEILGLHVRTVRSYVRNGSLPAVRIGKQYRIARSDVEKLLGTPLQSSALVNTEPTVEVSSVVEVKNISTGDMSRITTALTATAPSPRGTDIRTIYDPQRSTLKIILIGQPRPIAETLHSIEELTESLTTKK